MQCWIYLESSKELPTVVDEVVKSLQVSSSLMSTRFSLISRSISRQECGSSSCELYTDEYDVLR